LFLCRCTLRYGTVFTWSVLCCRVLRKAKEARHRATGHSTSKAWFTDASKGEGWIHFAGKQLGGTCSQAWTRQDSKGRQTFTCSWIFCILREVLNQLLIFCVTHLYFHRQALLGLAFLRFWNFFQIESWNYTYLLKSKFYQTCKVPLAAKNRKLKCTVLISRLVLDTSVFTKDLPTGSIIGHKPQCWSRTT